MSQADAKTSPRLWLWTAPIPDEVAAALNARGARPLAHQGPAAQVLRRAVASGEHLVQADLPCLAALIAAALELPETGAAAIQIDQGRGASLVFGPLGWALERCNVAGTGPHMAARR